MWKVENGSQVKFWLDAWLFTEPLVYLALANVGEIDMWRSVNSYWTCSIWNFAEFENLLLPEALLRYELFI